MSETAFLRGDRTALHAPTEDDAPFVADAVNDPDVWQSMDRIHPTTASEQADRLDELRGDDDAFRSSCARTATASGSSVCAC